MPKRKRDGESSTVSAGNGAGASSGATGAGGGAAASSLAATGSVDGLLTGTASARKGHYEVDCPYLDTIDRTVLDFDFQKVCSVTLSNQNVYTCLVCGKFFKGKAAKTPAFTHSVQW